MNAMSQRRDDRPAEDRKRPRTFMCREDLYRAFEARARELECSVDWLIAEAMKRLLKSEGRELRPAAPQPEPMPSRPRSLPPPFAAPLRLPPPPPPPPVRKPTGSFVGPKSHVGMEPERIALRVGDARAVVDRDRFVLGRSAKEAHFALREAGVSRQHAIVERSGSEWVIVDMASTNGVHVNGVRVTRAAIRPGDIVEIGPFAISVEPA